MIILAAIILLVFQEQIKRNKKMIQTIKKYWLLIKLVIFIGLFISLIISVKSCKSAREDNNRLKDNQKELLQGINIYRDKTGASVAEVNALTLQKNEFENLCKDQQKEIKELNISLKRIKSYSQTTTTTQVPITTILHDSVFVINNRIDTLRCLSYSDNYFSIDGCLNNDTLIGNVNCIDTLVQTISIIPKRFLFFKYGCKGLKQTIKSKNPYSTIISSEYIRIK